MILKTRQHEDCTNNTIKHSIIKPFSKPKSRFFSGRRICTSHICTDTCIPTIVLERRHSHYIGNGIKAKVIWNWMQGSDVDSISVTTIDYLLSVYKYKLRFDQGFKTMVKYLMIWGNHFFIKMFSRWMFFANVKR